MSLIHTNHNAEFCLYVALAVTAGKEHECSILYRLVEEFVQYHGRGVLKRLILDRGFLDGPQIGRCKKEWGIDVLIPARRDMDIYQDGIGLASGGLLDFKPWVALAPSTQPIPLHRPERVRKREQARHKTLARHKAQAPAASPPRSEVATVAGLESFSTCPVPLHAVVNRELYADGRKEYWVLLDTAPVSDPARTRQDYALRTTIEERHRQLKGFSDLEHFSSRALNLVVHQIVTIL